VASRARRGAGGDRGADCLSRVGARGMDHGRDDLDWRRQASHVRAV